MPGKTFFGRTARCLPLALSGLLLACSGDERPGAAFEAVEWQKADDAVCLAKGGQMVVVRNQDTEHTLEVVLDRWFMGVKTADRGHHVLAPGQPGLELGCSHTDGAEQRWELVDAKFVSG